MIIHFLKSAWRNLLRNRTFSLLNISGLAIGIASFILIMLFVNYETSYDRFFENSERIYRVYMDYLEGNEYVAGDAQTYNRSGPSLKNAFPEIEEYVRMYQLDKTSVIYNKNVFEVTNGHLADPAYFKVFNYPLLHGDVESALSNPNSVILTEKTAGQIFHTKNPVGEVVKLFYNKKMGEFTVTGVLKNIPENTYIKTNFLVSYDSNKNWHVCNSNLNWNNNNFFTYILLNASADVESLRSKIMSWKWDNNVSKERHNIELLTDIHLHSAKPYEAETNGNARSVVFLFSIAFIILILSWLNYTNLSIAKSMERGKETGVRKTSGAQKSHLIIQFLLESVLLNLTAIAIAIIVVILVLPAFNSFTNKNLFDAILNSNIFIFLFAIVIVGALVSGLYPAILTSNFNPIEIIKGKKPGNNHLMIRRLFVIFQFVASIVLLIGTLFIGKQIKYLQNQPLGFNNEQIIAVSGNVLEGGENLQNDYRVLKDEISKLPFVTSVASSLTYPGQGFSYLNSSTSMVLPNGVEDNQTVWYNYYIDKDYVPLMNLKIIAGRNFLDSEKSKNTIIINEKAALLMGFEDMESALNKFIEYGGNKKQIVGVIKNYHHFGFKSEIEPLVLNYMPIVLTQLLVKLEDKQITSAGIQNSLEQIKTIWENQFQHSTFNYNFIDKTFAAQFEEDRKFSLVFSFFTMLVIFIALLGLIGLASYICIQRTKEIGIRKVNGAKVSEILAMLNKDFIRWVAIAFVVACPIAYYAMNKWLENFAYKTTLSWWVFALAGVLAFGIALLTVSWQSWQVATRNPVEALKYE